MDESVTACSQLADAIEMRDINMVRASVLKVKEALKKVNEMNPRPSEATRKKWSADMTAAAKRVQDASMKVESKDPRFGKEVSEILKDLDL
jgi:hypothetical protein